MSGNQYRKQICPINKNREGPIQEKPSKDSASGNRVNGRWIHTGPGRGQQVNKRMMVKRQKKETGENGQERKGVMKKSRHAEQSVLIT